MNHIIDSSQKSDVYDHDIWQRGAFYHVKGHIMHYKCLAFGHQFGDEFCYINNIILPHSLNLNNPSNLQCMSELLEP